jgi:hypothetical protein
MVSLISPEINLISAPLLVMLSSANEWVSLNSCLRVFKLIPRGEGTDFFFTLKNTQTLIGFGVLMGDHSGAHIVNRSSIIRTTGSLLRFR